MPPLIYWQENSIVPPSLDIYGLTKQRDLQTITAFLDRYVDRAANEDRGDEELMLLPLDPHAKLHKLEDYEWEMANSLSHIIQRGLDYPRRSFTAYLSSKQDGIDQVTLSFTTDDQLILGLSIEYEGAPPEQLDIAEGLLNDLAKRYGCHRGLLLVEQPPPANEEEFLKEADGPYTELFRSF